MNRREALNRLAAAALVSGCSSMPPESIKQLSQLCPKGSTGPNPSDPLVVDVHCHVFNGSDLQVTDFIGKVVKKEKSLDPLLAELLGELANTIVWLIAPTAKKEGEVIDAALGKGAGAMVLTDAGRESLLEQRKLQKQRARTELSRAYRANDRIRTLTTAFLRSLQIPGKSKDLPAGERQRIEQLLKKIDSREPLLDSDIQAVFEVPGIGQVADLMVSMLQYRYSNCFESVEAYSCVGKSVDLFCPAMVDFDFWLGGGARTCSTIHDQLAVMEKVMRLMEGNFHAYAPFNPWAHLHDRDYFEDIKRAVLERGFVGVKLYPPMGFAPYGNQGLAPQEQPDIWKVPGAPTPRDLDRALEDLYKWCHAHSVPIIAHAGPSYGIDDRCDALGSPANWKKALVYIASLSRGAKDTSPNVCFGHVGGAYRKSEHRPAWAAQFAACCKEHPNAYGDLSYWEYFLWDPGSEQFRAARDELSAMRNSWPGMDQRLMYGSDWNLLILEQSWREYPLALSKGLAICGLDADTVRQVMGENAIRYLGLRRDGAVANRARLDDLYRVKWKASPLWRSKVDQLAA